MIKKSCKDPYQSPGKRRQCAVFAFPFIILSTNQKSREENESPNILLYKKQDKGMYKKTKEAHTDISTR